MEGEKLPLWRGFGGWAELGWCGEGAAQKKLPTWKRLTMSRGQDVKQKLFLSREEKSHMIFGPNEKFHMDKGEIEKS